MPSLHGEKEILEELKKGQCELRVEESESDSGAAGKTGNVLMFEHVRPCTRQGPVTCRVSARERDDVLQEIQCNLSILLTNAVHSK